MAGHSKWAQIKHKKAVTDSRRGKEFTKLARAIQVAAREGGGDPAGNAALANAVQKAKDARMPKDNIERAIAKGTGAGSDAEALETVVYEGYGPAELTMRPTSRVEVDEGQVGKLVRLIEQLEDHDDVAAVHANFDVDATVLERVAAA